MTDSVNSRDLILEILLVVTRDGEYSHLAVRSVLEKYQYLEKRDRSFITRVSEGTLENLIEIDYIIDSFSKTKTKKMKPVILNILRMGVYQLKYMDSVPESAVCNEAVKLAGKRGFKTLKGFVNGVLRNLARNLDSIEYPDEKKDFALALSVEYSIPKWMVFKWIKDYGREKAKSLAIASHREAPTIIRTNTDRISPEELKKRLEAQGISVKPVDVERLFHDSLSDGESHGNDLHTDKSDVMDSQTDKLLQEIDNVFEIENYDHIGAIPEFNEGLFVVQDVSSILVSALAGCKENDYCIDVCAAPGGKAIHMAELLKGTGYVEARDKSDYKVDMIKDTLARNQVKNAEAKVFDATVRDEDAVGKADIVIADLPCSGMGVIRRKTDIKYHLTEEGLDSLAALQREILDTVWQYVKSEGTLMFSTCTMNRDENENNTKYFLAKHKEFSLVFEKQLFFDNGISDGFYIAKMVRNNG
ncbi:MAG: 16S rRNA (cytosine(967)-C(5))-methyltransferase RsmB [Lachnospiraceae bacterium]|nr:16S rRNA (cytosine(967)-C(5))-methyltransferase RsmB [Lachnospiraceae bacterium]